MNDVVSIALIALLSFVLGAQVMYMVFDHYIYRPMANEAKESLKLAEKAIGVAEKANEVMERMRKQLPVVSPIQIKK